MCVDCTASKHTQHTNETKPSSLLAGATFFALRLEMDEFLLSVSSRCAKLQLLTALSLLLLELFSIARRCTELLLRESELRILRESSVTGVREPRDGYSLAAWSTEAHLSTKEMLSQRTVGDKIAALVTNSRESKV